MSIRGLCIIASLFTLTGLVACKSESPLSPATATGDAVGATAAPDVVGLAQSPQSERQVKVTICHVPPGNPDNAHEITVAEASLPAHFPHGDTLGTCDGEPPPPEECSGDCSELEEACCKLRIDCTWIQDDFENTFCEVTEVVTP